ncbi:BMP family ABC transporter substrate-binding protein [Gracilibacillus sp. S3-1-1]|uniref:BMP family ABC transporter substrate-binding protein n=1 Tax=Gracilibacillus pellucidus TaxID=3095368 RepID=A0ACC6M5C8_9BACI|nr:BMP family ABC transporter substrate-binding protein [Gracilibacillus sp. S3-1-1]MDX8046052.1 BMP family ABC transporter substrate-binding protein [Gracilibacillus sp. S3-1-1]
MEAKRQVRYILGITLFVVSILVILLIFKSNQILESMNTSKIESTKTLVLTSDKLDDQSWGSLAYKGKLRIEDQYNVAVEVLGNVDIEKDISTLVEKYVNDGFELIIGHGREFSEPFIEESDQFQGVQFVTIHGDNFSNNLAVYTFDQNEVEKAAGIAAALKTKTHKIGLIDPSSNGVQETVFLSGINLVDENIELLYEVVPERTSKSYAREIAASLIEQGVDVIYTKGNGYNPEVINYAKQHDVYTIGYLDDQSYMAKDSVLTSVMNNVPMAYDAIVRDYLSEAGIQPGKKILDEHDGVYGLAPLGPMFSQEEIHTLKQLTEVEIAY